MLPRFGYSGRNTSRRGKGAQIAVKSLYSFIIEALPALITPQIAAISAAYYNTAGILTAVSVKFLANSGKSVRVSIPRNIAHALQRNGGSAGFKAMITALNAGKEYPCFIAIPKLRDTANNANTSLAFTIYRYNDGKPDTNATWNCTVSAKAIQSYLTIEKKSIDSAKMADDAPIPEVF